jgi:hypothetical protein
MAQHDYNIANGSGSSVRSDINNALSAIATNNSGATEPTTPYAYQWWPDTTTDLLKIRNGSNNGWITVGTLSSANLGLLATAGTLTAALGSAGAPSITFTGDTNTGIYSPGPDQLAISAGGTDRLNIDSAGLITITGSLKDPAITGTIFEDIFTITDAAAFEIDPGNGSIQLITLGANRTPKATNFTAGEAITLMVDDGALRALTWTDSTWGGTGVVWKTDSATAPTLNSSGFTVITLWKVGTQVYGARVGNA